MCLYDFCLRSVRSVKSSSLDEVLLKSDISLASNPKFIAYAHAFEPISALNRSTAVWSTTHVYMYTLTIRCTR